MMTQLPKSDQINYLLINPPAHQYNEDKVEIKSMRLAIHLALKHIIVQSNGVWIEEFKEWELQLRLKDWRAISYLASVLAF